MTIKTISVVLDISSKRPAAALAIDLAKRLGAELTGVSPIFDPIVPGYAAAPMPADFIVAAREQAVDQANATAKRFSDAAAAAGCTAHTRVVDVIAGGFFDAMLGYCRLSDLAVVGQDDPDEPEPARVPAIEQVMFRGGTPLLLVPRNGPKTLGEGRAAIAWDGSGPAARAIRGALPLLERTGTVELVTVDGDQQPADNGAPNVVAYLKAHGITAEATSIESTGSIADTLLKHAADNKVDWLVMGGYGHSRLREFVMGGTTRHMLDHATVPIVMAH